MPETPDTKAMETNLELQAIKERQRLRDEHIDGKFTTMGDEIKNLDKRVGAQLGALDHKIDMGFDRIFREIKSERDEEGKRPASIRVNLLLGFVGVLFPTFTIAASVILLLVNPIKEGLHEHKTSHAHDGSSAERISLLEERSTRNANDIKEGFIKTDDESSRRDEAQGVAIKSIGNSVGVLMEQRVVDAERHGEGQARFEWLRDDAEAIKEDLSSHALLTNHPEALQKVSEIEGRLQVMEKQLYNLGHGGTTKKSTRPVEILRALKQGPEN